VRLQDLGQAEQELDGVPAVGLDLLEPLELVFAQHLLGHLEDLVDRQDVGAQGGVLLPVVAARPSNRHLPTR
jgi:hypothetical protein